MYKKVLIICLLFSFKATAQKFSVGVIATPEISNIKIVEPGNTETYGILAQTSGVIAVYDISKRFGLTSGLWYSTKGYHTTGRRRDHNGDIHDDVKHFSIINYLEVPLLLNIKAGGGSKVGFYSSVGPVLGIPLGVTWKDKPGMGYNQSYNSTYVSTVLSAYLGAGASIKFSEKLLFIIEPNVKRTLSKLYKPGAYEAYKHFYSIGLRFGLTYKI